MLLIQGLLTSITRSAGKIFNTAFGWATIMLFGKVPQDRQRVLSLLSVGSLAWIVVVFGVIFPGFATWLLAFVHPPAWIRDEWIRLGMLVAAFVIPAMLGGLSMFVVDPAERPRERSAQLRAVLRGYPYAVGIALTLAMMVVFAPIMQLRNIARRWTTVHIPIIVEPKDYESVVNKVQAALKKGSFETEQARASWMLRVPTKVLTTFARASFSNLVGDRLTALRSERIEVLLHPADLVMSARPEDAARARAILAEHLTFVEAYMAWDKEANELEDRLRDLWNDMRRQPVHRTQRSLVERLAAIEHDLAKVALPYEEWDIIYREKLLVERGLLQMVAGIADRPREPSEQHPEDITMAAERAEPRAAMLTVVPVLAGAAAIGALAGRWIGKKENNDEDQRAA